MKKISLCIAAMIAAFTLSFAAVPAYASGCPSGNDVTSANPGDGAKCADTGQTTKSLPQIIKDIVNVVLFVLGALAVVMLIYGGVTYSISAGDSAKITKAKHTIMYAIIGLVVAILAYAIVGFVVNNIK
jgi:hypothetical protein